MNEKQIIPVVCPDAIERFEGKRAAFLIEHRGDTRSHVGKFFIRLDPTQISIEIFPDLDGNLQSFERIHLTQGAVDSIRPAEGGEMEFADFVVVSPLNKCLFRQEATV